MEKTEKTQDFIAESSQANAPARSLHVDMKEKRFASGFFFRKNPGVEQQTWWQTQIDIGYMYIYTYKYKYKYDV